MSLDIKQPQLNNNPGKIRARLMSQIRWEDGVTKQSLYPGQLGVVTSPNDIPNPPSGYTLDQLAYLRVGPYNDNGSPTDYSRTLRVVPEPNTVTYSMMAKIGQGVIGNTGSTNENPQTISFDDLTKNYLTKFNSTNNIGVVDGSTNTVDWENSKALLNKDGTWTTPLKKGTVTVNYNGDDSSMSMSNSTLDIVVKVPQIKFSDLSGSIDPSNQISDSNKIPFNKLDKTSLVKDGAIIVFGNKTTPGDTDTSLFYLCSDGTLAINKAFTSGGSDWVKVVGVWG